MGLRPRYWHSLDYLLCFDCAGDQRPFAINVRFFGATSCLQHRGLGSKRTDNLWHVSL